MANEKPAPRPTQPDVATLVQDFLKLVSRLADEAGVSVDLKPAS